MKVSRPPGAAQNPKIDDFRSAKKSWKVSRPPGAAQTPKIDDVRSVKK